MLVRNVLVAYNGFANSTAAVTASNVLDDLRNMPTTHMSEVNHLHVCHWLREAGHSVSIIAQDSVGTGRFHFSQVPVGAVADSPKDALLIWKTHGLGLCSQYALLRYPWKCVIAWLDSPMPESVLGVTNTTKITRFAWGTPSILATERAKYPNAQHVLSEHATVFPYPPALSVATGRGLYAGRLPEVYAKQVVWASEVTPMLTYAFWVELGSKKILLRPWQVSSATLAQAKDMFPAAVDLRPAVNMIAAAYEASAAAFGLCPAAVLAPQMQLASASKFYDYLALGLPVVLADNTPEAAYVGANSFLGELYRQGDRQSLHTAVKRALVNASSLGFAERRIAIQQWVFANATYRHRAEVMLGLLQ